MKYYDIFTLKDGRQCCLRNGTEADAEAARDCFILTHEQTDYLLTYPDETSVIDVQQEAQFLKDKTESANEIEILAEVDGKVAGMAGIECMGSQEKVRHRADFGVSVDQAYWSLGIGRALTRACITCAKQAGYDQIELTVVADNKQAIDLYLSEGFTEFGRNPKGFKSRLSGWQETVLMRMELDTE